MIKQTNWETSASLIPTGDHQSKHAAGLKCLSGKQMFRAHVAPPYFTAWHWFLPVGPPVEGLSLETHQYLIRSC